MPSKATIGPPSAVPRLNILSSLVGVLERSKQYGAVAVVQEAIAQTTPLLGLYLFQKNRGVVPQFNLL
jgi:hypothetical protein